MNSSNGELSSDKKMIEFEFLHRFTYLQSSASRSSLWRLLVLSGKLASFTFSSFSGLNRVVNLVTHMSGKLDF